MLDLEKRQSSKSETESEEVKNFLISIKKDHLWATFKVMNFVTLLEFA